MKKKKAITQEENGIEISIMVADDIENITPKSAMGGTASAGNNLKKLSGSLEDLGETISITCSRIESRIGNNKTTGFDFGNLSLVEE